MANADTVIKQKQTTNLKEPGLYKVIFLNDNNTPMDFVVQVLVDIFKHSSVRAEDITMTIHHEGSGVAGVYPYEIAEQKTVETTVQAREFGYPLTVKIEVD